MERDREVMKVLRNAGLKVIIVWECYIRKMMKDSQKETETLQKIEAFISDPEWGETEYYE